MQVNKTLGSNDNIYEIHFFLSREQRFITKQKWETSAKLSWQTITTS